MRLVNLIAILAIAAVGFVGCDSESGSEADTYERQKALDDGDYDRVLELTENCGRDQACLLDRGGAYMGKAGFDAPTIITAVTGEDDDDKAYFAKLSPYIKDDTNGSLTNNAKLTYNRVIATRGYDTGSCRSTGVLNKYEKDGCANYGLAAISRSAVLANEVTKLYDRLNSSCNTIDDCFTPSDEINATLKDAVDLIFTDSDMLLALISKDGSDTKEKIGKIKNDICDGLDPCEADEVKNDLDKIFKYIIENK